MLDVIQQGLHLTLTGLKLQLRPTKPELYIRGVGSPQGQLAPTRLVAGWTKKTIFMNRGVALLVVDAPGTLPGQVVGAHKEQIGEQLGYIPFLYVMAAHLILVGPNLGQQPIDGLVDHINTMTVNTLSLHVADTVSRQVVKATSKTAFFSGAIMEGIDRSLASSLAGGGRVARVEA